MKVEKISLKRTGYFSESFLDYIASSEALSPFYRAKPTMESFQESIDSRNFPREKRQVLAQVLRRQYEDIETTDLLKKNLEGLEAENTFTITTGHQLNLFTGPLYFIYKIVTVINACKELKAEYPDYHFVPVYWMASEDHDFEEISYFYLHGKKHSWNTDQKGAVGRFSTEELDGLIDTLPGDVSLFKESYLQSDSLAEAVRKYVNVLFGESGLIVIDADDPSLKSQFKEVISSDLFEHKPKELVEEQSEKLRAVGAKVQVHPRDINLFFLEGNLRARIERQGDTYSLVDTETTFTADEIKAMVDKHPDRFSPNVVLRPLYQETILPNLAYVGGPSELVYWLQLKSVFEHFGTSFPILMPRNFGLVIPAHIHRTWSKTELPLEEIFAESHTLEQRWVESNGKSVSYQDEQDSIRAGFEQLKSKTADIDSTLVQHLDALMTKSVGLIDRAEKKLLRAEKRNNSDAMRQICTVKEQLFPGGSLQERRDNFLNFYQENPDFISDLLEAFAAFDYRMHVLIYDR